jgi:cytochrome P450
VLEELFERFTHFELAGPPERGRSTIVNPVASLPVTCRF